MIIDSYINTPSNSKGKVKLRWFAKPSGTTYTYAATLALTLGNIFGVQQLGNERRVNILNNGPTQFTIAVVSSIEVSRGKSSDYYYAIFEYQAAGHTVRHRRGEDNGEFVPGQRFKIQYSVDYPDMFRIIKMLP